MRPPHQRLERHDPPRPRLHDRLVDVVELVPVERLAQVSLDRDPRKRQLAHRVVEELAAGTAVLLGHIHGGIANWTELEAYTCYLQVIT